MKTMKMYLPFGDWSGDGHKQWDKVLIEAPSMEHLLNAQKEIRAKYGENFFDYFAHDYEDAGLGEIVWQALEDAQYPITRLAEKDDCNDWVGVESLKERRGYSFSIDVIIDTFIWLLNAYGAQIIVLDATEDIPMICNWTCSGFKTVGYGCYWS